MGLTKLNSIHVSSSPVMGWVELDFFFNPLWWVGLKKLLNLIQPDPCTPLLTSH